MEKFDDTKFKEYLRIKKIIKQQEVKMFEILGEEIIDLGEKKIKIELVKYANNILPYFKGFVK